MQKIVIENENLYQLVEATSPQKPAWALQIFCTVEHRFTDIKRLTIMQTVYTAILRQ